MLLSWLVVCAYSMLVWIAVVFGNERRTKQSNAMIFMLHD